ncbi:hypothetical protein [Lysobacter sp. CA199]|uniref:hypothetical protein n=1 Tax=Lysobacter sp. CA199 TaxID=3455608 RepID=UPI003F8D1B3E
MKFFLTMYSNWAAKIDHALRPVERLEEFFQNRHYGEGLKDIRVMLMCCDAQTASSQRHRYHKDRAALSMDVMLDLDRFIAATHAQRRQWIYDAMLEEIPRIIRKKKLKDFDLDAFQADLRTRLGQQLLGPDAARFDHLVLERATGF